MNLSTILAGVSDKATSVRFEVKNVGVNCWAVRVCPNRGNDFILPTQHPTVEEARQEIKELNLAYKLGEKMHARAVMAKVKSKI